MPDLRVPRSERTPLRAFARLDFDAAADEWASGIDAHGTRVLRRHLPLELEAASGATLIFTSSVTGGAGLADVQVSLDGVTWQTLVRVPPDENWTDVSVDLGAWIGSRVWVRFAFTPEPGETGSWRVADVRVRRY
jgi:hypothetical protein